MTKGHLRDEPHYVYRMYDAEDFLLYVGCTSNLGARLQSHGLYKPWFTYVARIEVAPYENAEAGLAAEADAIEHERPIYHGVGEAGAQGIKRLCVGCRQGRHARCSTDKRMSGRWGFSYPCSCTACEGKKTSTPKPQVA